MKEKNLNCHFYKNFEYEGKNFKFEGLKMKE